MRPHVPGTSSRAPTTVPTLALALLLLAVGACSAEPGGTAAPTDAPTGGTSTSPSVDSSTTTLGPSRSPARPTKPSSSTSSHPPFSSPPPKKPTLADYLARLPSFPAAPRPVAVVLPHADGRAAWASRIPTTQKVAFLTIDDGVVKSSDAIALMRAAHVPVTLFLTADTIAGDKGYFAGLEDLGAVIESHTLTHPNLTKLDYAHQQHEICHATDLLGEWYGRRPVLFRPPYGEKNDDTLRAAFSCGLIAGFFWKETVNDGVVRYQTSVHNIQRGDIILMHFRTTFAADFVAALLAIKAAGLTPALLENYVAVPAAPPPPSP